MFKLSIITINRNNAAGLLKTIESVVSQTFTDFEYIVIDGASTDESVNIIMNYANKIDYWVSEPDNGIYNAMNKGILQAKGEYLLFLNSGDWLYNENAIIKISNILYDYDIVGGYVLDENGTIRKSPEEFTFKTLYHINIPHQAEFIKKKLFEEIGYYDERLKILADYKFNILALIKNAKVLLIKQSIAVTDMNGISNTLNSIEIINNERKKIFDELIPKGILIDYENWLNTKTHSHKAIIWLFKNKILFKLLKLIYKHFGNDD